MNAGTLRKMDLAKSSLIAILLASFAAHAEDRNYSSQFLQYQKMASNNAIHAECVTAEIALQKKWLNSAYAKVVKKLTREARLSLDKTQHEWIIWRGDNYNFLAEHVPGSFDTTRITSLSFLLKWIFERASELEMIFDEMGENSPEV